jgi:predicted HTH transcriptional regulator
MTPTQHAFRFDAPLPDVCRNHHGGEAFSEAANKATTLRKASKRALILEYLGRVGDGTSEEAEIALGMSHQTASARFAELKKDGLIVPIVAGEQLSRSTRSGCDGGVWRLAMGRDRM